MKRLLLATDAWHPQVNGVVRILDRLARDLPRHGIQVDVLSPAGFRTVPLPTYGEIRLALCSPSRLARRIDLAAPDFVHIATEGPIGFMTRRWCLANDVSFTTSFHTRFPEYLAARLPVPVSLTYAWMRRFHNAGLGVMVSNDILADELVQYGFRNPLVWPRGIDTDMFCPGPAAPLDLPRPVYAYVGRIAVEKGVADFLALDLPGSKLVVGDGPQRAAFERRYPDVRFVGLRHGDDLVRMYRAADVFVFPSRTDTLGLVMIEAMACGVPVAAYRENGPLHVIGDSGAGVAADDLRSAALAALDIPAQMCRDRALDFSVDRSTAAFAHLVRNANVAHDPHQAAA